MMVEQVTAMLTQMLTWVGSVISSLIGASGGLAPLLPLAMVAVACSVIFFAVKTIRSIIWGY